MWVVSTKPLKGDWKNDRVVNYKSQDGQNMRKISTGQEASSLLKPAPVQKDVPTAWRDVDSGKKTTYGATKDGWATRYYQDAQDIHHRALPQKEISQVFKASTYTNKTQLQEQIRGDKILDKNPSSKVPFQNLAHKVPTREDEFLKEHSVITPRGRAESDTLPNGPGYVESIPTGIRLEANHGSEMSSMRPTGVDMIQLQNSEAGNAH